MALILIVDDALLSRTMVKKILKANNHNTIEAKDGEEALLMIEKYQPEFICLDMLIPKYNGIEVLEILQSKDYSIPVVVITADTQGTTREKCLQLGAINVLNKPVNKEKLTEIINNSLNLNE